MIRKSAGDPDGPELRGIGGRVRGRHVLLDMIRQGRIEMKWLQDCSRVVVMIRVRSDLERFLVICTIKPCTCGSLSIAVTYLYMFVPSELSSFSSSSCLVADQQTAAIVATLPTWLSRYIHGRYRGAIPRVLLTARDCIAGSDDKILGYTCVSSEYRNRPRPRMFGSGVCAWSSTHAIDTRMPSSFHLRGSPCRRKDRVILSNRPPHAHLYPPIIFTKRA